ncbi:DUF2268 domain-containing putative Zn-dependent protease [Candidatus Nanohalococcus occultus]|uniref:DUF2268 domain-containing putative Zn-dependent protease n=1 Tax=Candidatus Nanohalococcus occultus TaxID=2978047 RepID=UPI0039E188B8
MTECEIRPTSEQIREAREQIRKGLKTASGRLSKSEELNVDICWTSDDFVKEKMGGASGMCYSANRIEVKFNSSVGGWKENLIGTAIHEYTHSWFYEQIGGTTDAEWRYILDEALTQNMTEMLFPEADEPWRTEHSIDTLAKYWPQIKEEELDGDDNEWPDPLFISQGEDGYPNWLGYSLAYRIGKKLLETNKPEDFPGLTKEDVVQAGDELFGEDR